MDELCERRHIRKKCVSMQMTTDCGEQKNTCYADPHLACDKGRKKREKRENNMIFNNNLFI